MGEGDNNNDAKPALYQKLNQDGLIHLEERFKTSEEQKFTINQLETVLKEFNISFSPDRLKSFFLKVNLNFVVVFVSLMKREFLGQYVP